MIRFSSKKLKSPAPDIATPSPETAPTVLAPARVRRSGGPMRLIGNLLIVVGVLMLAGIGGWYGYTQWSNDRYKQELVSEFGPQAVDPPVTTSADLHPTATVPPPLPVLNNIGTGMLGIANKIHTEVDNSPPVRLYIPSVKIDSKVVPVSWSMIPAPGGGMKSEWQVADYAVGHHAGTANPGQPGNVVMSGHVDYRGQVFKDLDKVNKGDEVTVYTEKGQYMYVVINKVLVKEEGVSQEQKARNAAYMDPTPDQTLTMITCWPYGIDNYRLIVIAKPYQSTLSTQSDFSIR
jgi:sortase A